MSWEEYMVRAIAKDRNVTLTDAQLKELVDSVTYSDLATELETSVSEAIGEL